MVALMMIVLVSFRSGALAFQSGSVLQEPLKQEPLKTYKVVSSETYERVLDIVFSRNEPTQNYDFVLRFKPSFAPESQILVKTPIIFKGAVDKVEVVTYTSLSGNIYGVLNSTMAHGGKEDPVEMAKLIQVQKRVIEVPIARVRQWRRNLAAAFGASMKRLELRAAESERGIGTITIDGTFYDLRYDQVGSHISFSVLDHEVSNREVTGGLEIVRWMNTLRRDVEGYVSVSLRKRAANN